ncbi:phage tail tube protein [Streptomyces sp. NPDC050421]|uniref:phage tail tube protein n=1 Tax=Streptomyces sp. NPDC050421 TaxID=3365613 RepID=UPI0037B6620C
MALDASIGISPEATYGTPAAKVEGYEGKADSWKTTREFIESVGFRAGMQTARADRRNIVNMGGEGELEVDLLDAGASGLLSAVFDKHDGGTPDAVTGLTAHVFNTDSVTSAPSFTSQMLRPTVEGTHVAYRHVGCVATEFSLTAEVENPVVLNVTFDFQDVSHSSTSSEFLPIAYPEESYAYDWTRAAITIKRAGASVVFDVNSFELTGELGLKVDRRFLRGNQLKKKPVRNAVPTYEGTFEGEFGDGSLALYEAFLAGESVEFALELEGMIPGTSVKVDCPAIQFTGESPEASVDEVSIFNLPFRVLDPGSGADAITVTYVEPTPGFVPTP